MSNFNLNLDFEKLEPNSFDRENGFSHVDLKLDDGRSYKIKIWTFQYVETVRQLEAKDLKDGTSQYLIPPDLLVKELTRACIEKSIEDILDQGDLELILKLKDTPYL